ncbi:lysostaphin resistance A-like protein [Paenibacillus sp. 2TAB26]|uniref:CPBP family intramembrane glutamic endopeptidase n=1 Tax=Paenibacillus sp. 2TAB26 TaxID=3233005 RepID=UPI003F959F34
MITTVSFTVKRPIVALILIELMLMIFVAGGSAYVSIAELTHPLAPFLGFIPIALFLVIYMTLKKRWSTFYFSGVSKLTKQQWLEYLPLLLVLIVLLIANKGFQPASFSFFAYMLLSQLFLVGFVEETLFRGMMLRILMPKGKMTAVIVSSALFGVTHALQALGGQSIEDTLLQIGYAFIVGFVLAMLVVRNRAILLTILFHGLHNFLNFTGNDPDTHLYDYLVIAILAVQLIWLLSSSKKNSINTNTIYT